MRPATQDPEHNTKCGNACAVVGLLACCGIPAGLVYSIIKTAQFCNAGRQQDNRESMYLHCIGFIALEAVALLLWFICVVAATYSAVSAAQERRERYHAFHSGYGGIIGVANITPPPVAQTPMAAP